MQKNCQIQAKSLVTLLKKNKEKQKYIYNFSLLVFSPETTVFLHMHAVFFFLWNNVIITKVIKIAV